MKFLKKLLLVVSFLWIFLLAFFPISSNDFWWLLNTGKKIVLSGSIPTFDDFSYGSSLPRIDHTWLTEVLFYKGYALGGFRFLILLKAGIIALSFWLLFKNLTLRGVNFLLALVLVLLSAFSSRSTFILRPQIFSFLLFSLSLFLLEFEGREKRRKPLFFLPLLTLVWVNLHGQFILLFLPLVAYLLGSIFYAEKMKFFLFLLILSLGATFVNPYLGKIYLPFFEHLGSRTLWFRYIAEWRSPDFHIHWGFEVLFLLCLFAFIISPRRPKFKDILIFLGLSPLALYSVRNIPFFVLGVVPFLGEELGEGLRRWRKKLNFSFPPRFKSLPYLVFFFLILFLFPSRFPPLKAIFSHPVNLYRFPRGAVDYIKKNLPPPRMFNAYDWGGYLGWKLYPRYQVFIDGRSPIYTQRHYQNYLTVLNVWPGWKRILTEYRVNFVVTYAQRYHSLPEALRESGEWRKVYQDEVAIIFVRKEILR